VTDDGRSEGTRLTVHVQPRARNDEITGFDEIDRLRVRVRAAPSDGAANEAVIALLAAALDIPRRRVELERGHTSRTKRVMVHGLSETVVRKAMAAVSP